MRVLADDLTGALDSGARLSALSEGLRVGWRESFVPGRSAAIDTESRAAPDGAEAAASVARRLAWLGEADTAFLKIDSLLRGHPADEIATCVRSGRFASVVIAPAFPAQGRVTRGGRQHVAAGPGLIAVGPALTDGIAARSGRPISVLPRGEAPRGAGIFSCDAETDADLASIARADLAAPTLWCGTGGLAGALARGPRLVAVPAARAVLIVVGTAHPVTAAQVAELETAHPGSNVDFGPSSPADVASCSTARLGRGAPVVLRFRPEREAKEEGQLAVALGALLPALLRPELLVVTGGATLRLVLEMLGADHLRTAGEIEPGLPLSRIMGGAWNGVPLISKSGAFGRPQALADLVRRARR